MLRRSPRRPAGVHGPSAGQARRYATRVGRRTTWSDESHRVHDRVLARPDSRLGIAERSHLALAEATRRIVGRKLLIEFALPKPRRPHPASPDELNITRDGDYVIIAYADNSVATTQFQLGRERIATMTDDEIIAVWNEHLEARDAAMASYEHIAVEVPPGRPQIDTIDLICECAVSPSALRLLLIPSEPIYCFQVTDDGTVSRHIWLVSSDDGAHGRRWLAVDANAFAPVQLRPFFEQHLDAAVATELRRVASHFGGE